MQKKENEILVDVVIRFCVHKQYGSFEKAEAALMKRLQLTDKNINNLMKHHVDIFEYCKNFVLKLMRNVHVKANTFDNAVKEISEHFQSDREIVSSYLNFCHYYYILK